MNEGSRQEGKAELEMIRKHCETLSEHFDSVQIFVSRYEDGNTVSVNDGMGNWFARLGQVQKWAEKQNEEARVEVRKYDDSE